MHMTGRYSRPTAENKTNQTTLDGEMNASNYINPEEAGSILIQKVRITKYLKNN
jgi:hypothetical protein